MKRNGSVLIDVPSLSVVGVEKGLAKVDALRFMPGRGLKRKLSDSEDNMASISSAFDCSPSLPYALQRQLVLNVCLTKLHSYKMLVEPDLHRSVLIANTVRQIQEELRQETSQQSATLYVSPTSSMCSFPGTDLSGLHSTLPSVLNSHQDCNGNGACTADSSVESGLMVSDDEMSSAISSILKDLDFMEDISPSQCVSSQDDPVSSLTNVALRPEYDSVHQELRVTESVFNSLEISNSTSYLTDLPFDDIFEDIDTSMYDSDVCIIPLTSPRSPTSVADETMKNFISCNSQSANGIQNNRSDLSDLDNIMEILVGS